MLPTESILGQLPDGQTVRQWRLSDFDQEVVFCDFGARLLGWRVLFDTSWRSILFGDTSLSYISGDGLSMGATIGRFANRIAHAEFVLNNQLVSLEANEGQNQLHGGNPGFAGRVWQTDRLDHGICFSYQSPSGEGGYPGNLDVRVTYVLTEAGLEIHYDAETDADTVLNLTNHAYFNLSAGEADVLGHSLMIDADHYLPVREDKIPTGEVKPVASTVFDFSSGAVVGEQLAAGDAQFQITNGFDHCFVLNTGSPNQARLTSPDGLVLNITTSEPGLQLYTGNHLQPKHAALALETQHFPDSPNQSGFPSAVLTSGEKFSSFTHLQLEREAS